MKLIPRAAEIPSIAASALLLALASPVFAIDIWTVGVDNTRQGWNKFETVLTPANVPQLRKTREFPVDEKIDVSPLVVGSKLYVFTMRNTAYVFDVNTGADLASGSSRRRSIPTGPRQWANGQMADLSELGNHGDARDRRRYEQPLCDDLRESEPPKQQQGSADDVLWILDADTLADKNRRS